MIAILGETLEPFDDDGLIPTFGFGDASSRDKTVFPFRSEVSIAMKTTLAYDQLYSIATVTARLMLMYFGY